MNDQPNLRERITLAIMGRTAPRAADAVLAELGYGTHRCARCGQQQAREDDTCPPCDLAIGREEINRLREQLDRVHEDHEVAIDNLRSDLTAEYEDAYKDARQAEAERDRLRTWPGLMETLAQHYPPDVIDGRSGDPGPQIITLAREVDRLREAVERVREIISDALEAWEPQYEYARDRAATKGYSHDQTEADTYELAIGTVKAILTALDQSDTSTPQQTSDDTYAAGTERNEAERDV